MSIPNLFTLFRLILIVPFCFLVTGGVQYDVLAFIVFIVAAFTDWFDGYYARRFKQFSDAGKLFDPLADKLLVTTALVAFVQDPILQLPVWTVVVILGREFLITGFRSLLASKNIVMAADQLGKAKTVAQMCAILVYLVSRTPDSQSFLVIGHSIYYLAVILTVVSGLDYLWRYRAILIQSLKADPVSDSEL